jgi:hypothetical protein
MCLNELSELVKKPSSHLPTIEDRVRHLLTLIAEEIRPCKACEATLYFVRHTNGARAPYTEDAVNHFVNCPKANDFKRRKRG